MRKRGGRGQGRSAAEPDVILQIVIGAGDARRLMRLAAAARLTAEACAASIVAEVLADDEAAHGVEQGPGEPRQPDLADFPDRPAGGWLQ